MKPWMSGILFCITSLPWLAYAEQTIYSQKTEGIFQSYRKLEPSGCTTQLALIPKWSMIRISYLGACVKPEESTTEIVQSLHDIVANFQLTDSIKTMRQMEVDITWKVSHWPLLQLLNNDPDWPNNASSYFARKSGDPKIKKYIELMRSKLLAADVYGPFLSFMTAQGCSTTLKPYYADPLYPGKDSISKQQLIKWGVYTSEQAHKTVYPNIIGFVGFKFSCTTHPAPTTSPAPHE